MGNNKDGGRGRERERGRERAIDINIPKGCGVTEFRERSPPAYNNEPGFSLYIYIYRRERASFWI